MTSSERPDDFYDFHPTEFKELPNAKQLNETDAVFEDHPIYPFVFPGPAYLDRPEYAYISEYVFKEMKKGVAGKPFEYFIENNRTYGAYRALSNAELYDYFRLFMEKKILPASIMKTFCDILTANEMHFKRILYPTYDWKFIQSLEQQNNIIFLGTTPISNVPALAMVRYDKLNSLIILVHTVGTMLGGPPRWILLYLHYYPEDDGVFADPDYDTPWNLHLSIFDPSNVIKNERVLLEFFERIVRSNSTILQNWAYLFIHLIKEFTACIYALNHQDDATYQAQLPDKINPPDFTPDTFMNEFVTLLHSPDASKPPKIQVCYVIEELHPESSPIPLFFKDPRNYYVSGQWCIWMAGLLSSQYMPFQSQRVLVHWCLETFKCYNNIVTAGMNERILVNILALGCGSLLLRHRQNGYTYDYRPDYPSQEDIDKAMRLSGIAPDLESSKINLTGVWTAISIRFVDLIQQYVKRHKLPVLCFSFDRYGADLSLIKALAHPQNYETIVGTHSAQTTPLGDGHQVTFAASPANTKILFCFDSSGYFNQNRVRFQHSLSMPHSCRKYLDIFRGEGYQIVPVRADARYQLTGPTCSLWSCWFTFYDAIIRYYLRSPISPSLDLYTLIPPAYYGYVTGNAASALNIRNFSAFIIDCVRRGEIPLQNYSRYSAVFATRERNPVNPAGPLEWFEQEFPETADPRPVEDRNLEYDYTVRPDPDFPPLDPRTQPIDPHYIDTPEYDDIRSTFGFGKHKKRKNE